MRESRKNNKMAYTNASKWLYKRAGIWGKSVENMLTFIWFICSMDPL